MVKTDIVGEFGESFIRSILYCLGFEVDKINSTGIDIACYNKEIKLGISVKTRNIQFNRNDSINLTYNDIVYTNAESELRDLIPAYAFVICDLKRMDILIVTQEFVFNNLINHDKAADYSIEDYKKHYSSKHVSGSTKSISTTSNSKEKWKTLKNERGVIYTCSYVTN